ncbi:MAG: dihydropteroate synthase [Deltaproteobacteria bacterium]
MPDPLIIGEHRWDWSRPYILGILNVTPDSFSDGGLHAGETAALAHAERLLLDGADAIDVGGESTRPGAPAVSADEESARVVPVIRALVARGVLVSVDTTKAAVAHAALEAGARILNDVGMGDSLESLAPIAVAHGAAYLRMHSRGTPATMTSLTDYADVVATVCTDLARDAAALCASGLTQSRILLDPGIGFAKRAEQSLSLLAAVARLRSLGYAVCVGPSRKSFIDAADAYHPHWTVARATPDQRLGGTAAAVALAVAQGAEVLRVHDVSVMRQAARVAHAIALRGREVRRV